MLFLNLILTINAAFNLYYFTTQSTFSYKLCDTYQAFQIEEFVLTPSRPIKGKNLNINVKGFLNNEIISGSQVTVYVSYIGLSIFKKKYDLCHMLDTTKNSPTKCPITVGKKSWTYNLDIPKKLPSGKYDIKLDINNSNGDILMCSYIYVTI